MTTEYKAQLNRWAMRVCNKWQDFLPGNFSLNQFVSDIGKVSDEVAYGIALGLKYAIDQTVALKYQQKSNGTRRMYLRTHKSNDGKKVRLFDPFTGNTYAYYGVDEQGLPFYVGNEDYNMLGRAGFMGSGGLFDQLSDGDALNYQAKKPFRMQKAA